MALRSAALFLFGAAAIAAQVSGVSVDGVTAQQAVITFQVPDAAQCTLRVFRDSGRTQLADDTNEALFAGSTACNRTGSAVNGKRVSFVAGLRTSQLARDGLMHSRSLATLTTYYYTITDEVTQASQQGQFTTANLPSGNLYPEQVPWDANGFGNAAYPNLDFGGTGQGCGGANGNAGACIDPVTGLQYWLFTSAGAHGSLSTPWNGAQTLFQTPVLSGGSCDTAANMVNNPGNHFATCNGPMSALLTAQNWIPPNTYNPVYQFGVSYGKGQFNPLATVDDMIVAVDGYASDANNQDNEVDVCLWSGAANACLGNTFTITLPVGSAGSAQQFNVPHDVPKPYWQDWGYAPDQGNVSQPTFRVWRRGAGGSVSLSVWFTGATSMAWWNYESVPVRCEDNPRDIAWDRNGNALNAHLQGYFCYATDQQNPIPELWLWIPFNPDGTLRAETRWMGTVYNTTNFVNYNGAVMGFQGAYVYAAYPATGPTDVARFTYNTEKFPYCHYNDLRTVTDPENGGWYASNTQGYAPDSCFDRQIVTNGALHMMLSAWAAKHPDLSDPTNFTNAGSAGIIFAHGLITFSVASNPSWGDTLHVIGMFDPDGNLLGVSDDFTNHECAGGSGPTCSGGTWVPKMGWALNHGGTAGMPGGQYAMIGILNTPPSDGSMALAGPWSVPVLAVNRRGFGAAAVWDCSGCQGGPTQTSTIGDADMYQCPNTPITERLCPNGAGAGKCCVEVKVNQEPCSVTPYAKTKTFINNAATEAEGFPCTSTDNKTMVNAAWSKLQNSQVGDWLMENNANNGAVGADAESFVLAQKSLDGAGNVNAMWLVRESNAGVDAKLWAPLPPHSLSATRHPCLDPPNCSASKAAWSLKMRPQYEQLPAGDWQIPANGGAPVPDNPAWFNAHHEDGPMMRASSATYGSAPYFYQVATGPFASTIFKPLTPTAPQLPTFSGSSAPVNTAIQTYFAVTQNPGASAVDPTTYLSWRHDNPSYGGGPFQESAFCSYQATAVSGSIYRLSSSGTGWSTDCYSAAADPKRIPFVARANPVLLRDVSGPLSAAVFPKTDDAACYALNANECVPGSAPASYYVNVRGATYANGCTNLYTLPADEGGAPRPCFYSASPVGGRLEEIDAARPSQDGSTLRLLSYVHSIPGGVAQQTYPSLDSTGRFALVSSGMLDGRRQDILAVYVPPMTQDAVNRTTYRQVTKTIPRGAGEQVRVCWGYAENAPGYDLAQGLFPMPRQERGCSDATGAQPFLWESEQQNYTECSSGCSVTMNLISGRVAYYTVESRGPAKLPTPSHIEVMAVN